MMIDPIQYQPTIGKFIAMTNYLTHKYKMPKLFPSLSAQEFDNSGLFVGNMMITWFVNHLGMRILQVPPFYKRVVEQFMRSRHQRFIALPIVMFHPQSIYNPEMTHGIDNLFTHIVIAIYDKVNRRLERFDSGNNWVTFDGHLFDTVLLSTLNGMFEWDVKTIETPWTICQHQGIQQLQEQEIYKSNIQPMLGSNIGFCTIFALWFLEQRMKNHEARSCNLIERAIYNTKNRYPGHKFAFTMMIISYTKHILLASGVERSFALNSKKKSEWKARGL